MNGINPQTGKRLGKFLWRDSEEEQDAYLRQLRSKIADGFFTSDAVLSSLVDEIAPAVSSSIDIEVVA